MTQVMFAVSPGMSTWFGTPSEAILDQFQKNGALLAKEACLPYKGSDVLEIAVEQLLIQPDPQDLGFGWGCFGWG